MSLAYIYTLQETANGKVNLEKLDLEIRASTVPDYVTPPKMYSGNIFIEVENGLSAADKLILDGIVANHDGEEADVSEDSVNKRENKIRELTELALLHPLLDNVDSVRYLTSIDNMFNAWKRSGVDTVLIEQIVADATSGVHPQDAFLNEVVNAEGNKTYEFLISVIQS